MRHYNIILKGRVHGVGFRFAAKQKATGLHIHGFVRNQEDGSLYIEAEGQEDELEEFYAWCHRGPWFAKVLEISFEEDKMVGYNEFEIK